MSRMIKASEFKAKCLAVLDEVEWTQEPVVITKRGKPVPDICRISGKGTDFSACTRDEWKFWETSFRPSM